MSGSARADRQPIASPCTQICRIDPATGWCVGCGRPVLVAGGWLTTGWIGSQYYVGEQQGNVAIYNGVSQSLGPVSLSDLERATDLRIEDLPGFAQARVRNAIPADSLEEAERIVRELREYAPEAVDGAEPRPTGTVRRATASPSATAGGDR